MKPVNGQVNSTCYQGQSAKQYDGRSRASSDGGWKVHMKSVGGVGRFSEGPGVP